MIALNLLSKQDKQLVKQNIYLRLTQRYVFTAVFAVAIIAGALFANKYIAQKNIDELQGKIQAATQATILDQGGSLQDNIKKINTQLKAISAVQANFVPWGPTLVDFFHYFPAGISLSSFSADSETKVVNIQGTAKTRADLIAFRDSLSTIPYFTATQSPVSDLTQRTNIQFEVSGTLKSNFWKLIPRSQ